MPKKVPQKVMAIGTIEEVCVGAMCSMIKELKHVGLSLLFRIRNLMNPFKIRSMNNSFL